MAHLNCEYCVIFIQRVCVCVCVCVCACMCEKQKEIPFGK